MTELTQVITGQNIHITAWEEDSLSGGSGSWGTKPASPTYVFLPCYSYGVKFNTTRRNSRPHLGQYTVKHGRRYKGIPSGPLSGPMTANVASFLMDWVFDGDGVNFPASIGCERAEGPDVANEQANGLMVNNFTLSGDEDSGNVVWSIDAMGHSVGTVGTAQEVPGDLDSLSDFEFVDAVLTIDSTATQMSGFSLSRQNNLVAKWLGSLTPQTLARTQQTTNLSFELPKQASTYDVVRRLLTEETEYDVQLAVAGITGAGTTTTITFDMPRCQVIDPDDSYGVDQLTMTTVNMECLKPDTSEQEIAVTVATA